MITEPWMRGELATPHRVAIGSLMGDQGAVFGGGEDTGFDPYRLILWRNHVEHPTARCCFVMLNPSTANAFKLDPTITRCVDFTKRWGFDATDVVNLFAWRSTNPKALRLVSDPVGPGNDVAIEAVARSAARIVVAYGVHARRSRRPEDVLSMLARIGDVWCIRLTEKTLAPEHPLYIPADTKPFVYRPMDT